MATLDYLTPELKQDFIALIAKQTGIEIREQNYASLNENVRSRVKTLSLMTPDAYYNLLATPSLSSEQEWQKFVCLMTNKESYFFRDKGQFILLRNHIFPELLQRKQKTQSLRILSAGCSTGQEPYSLAILLRQMVSDLAGWNFQILGVDINQDAIKQAEKASYNAWSFRQVDDEIKEKYFTLAHDQYTLQPHVKNMVKFERVNLAKDLFPKMDSELRDMDLIICRNVFIYFTDSAIHEVVDKFYQTLQMGGYLLTGHAELDAGKVKKFQVHLFPESVIYQKTGKWSNVSSISHQPTQPEKTALEKLAHQLDNTLIRSPHLPEKPKFTSQPKPLETFLPQIKSSPNPSLFPPKVPLDSPAKTGISGEDLLKEAQGLIQAKSYHLASKKIEEVLKTSPRSFQGHYLLAQIHANLGKYEEAIKSCNRAIELDSFFVDPHRLLAQISEEKGDYEQAKEILKKIIYLEPYSVTAYLNLANLYQQEGDNKRAIKMQQSALKILKGLPGDTPVPELGNVTAQELLAQLEVQ